MNRQTDQPIRRPLDHAECGLHTYFDDIDRAAVDTLAEKYGHLVPEERIRAMRDLPTQFEDRKQFRASFTKAAGERPGREVAGFSHGLDTPAHVLIENMQDVPEIVFHERTHQLSDPGAEQILGRPLYEGATEDIAFNAAQLNPEIWPAQGYPEETRLASRLRETVGREAYEKAYFQGDATELRQNFERCLHEIPDINESRHQN